MLTTVREQDEAVRFLTKVLEGTYTSPLLLVGSEGTGRKFAVRCLIQDLFCSGTRAADCPCVDCEQVRKGVHPDYQELAADEKDIGIDAVRSIVEAAYSYPSMARYRVFLIDGVDRMTTAAANAFLKTLEEPPATTLFFLLAQSPGAVLPTIRSRCGLVSFHTLSEAYVLSKLQQYEADPTKALVYTRMGEGSVGRSIQFWGSGRLALRDKALNLLRLAAAKDVVGLFSLVDALDKELPLALRFIDQLLHDILMISTLPDKLINLDLQEVLGKLRVCASGAVWHGLMRQLRDVRLSYQKVKINLGFHVKAIFVQTFAG